MRATWRAVAGAGFLIVSGYACLLFHRLTKSRRGDAQDVAVGMLHGWSPWARRALRLRLHTVGVVPLQSGAIIVNHRSYLDALVVGSAFRTTFLCRGDVVDWPLIGPVLQEIGAVFVDRDALSGRARAARVLLRRLAQAPVAIFPEGTTSDAALPAEFPLGLFRLLHRTAVPIIPATIIYDTQRAHWVEDLSLWCHIRDRVAAGPPIVATLHIGAAISPSDSATPEELLARVYAAVAAPLVAVADAGGVVTNTAAASR